ncbi:acyl-CoA synthetase [Alteromonas sp. M12]|uniref:acyl-CoA synthetase n=1 Tax=Alteromonas sp. M12 TaxID=3135644 RepID=UPI00319DA7B7
MHPSIHAQKNPTKPAYIIADTNETVTYGELDIASNQGAHLFRSLGLNPGDHIALMMENNRHFFSIVWAAQRAGIIFTAVSSHLKAEEVAYIVDNCDAKAFIISEKMQAVGNAVLSCLSKELQGFMVNGQTNLFSSWEEATKELPTTPIANECAGVHMLYSSGTTGRPKGIYPTWEDGRPITHMEPGMILLRDFFKLNENTVYLSPAPLYHAAPLIYNMLVMFQGGTSIIMEKFDAELNLQLIEKYKVNIGQWVPIMFIRMLKLAESTRTKYDVSSLKCAIHAAAPCPQEIKQAMIDWWGPILTEYYSSTENAGVTLLSSEQWLSHPGSVGSPLGCIIHILDEDGNELPTGEIGEVFFENPRSNFEYYKEPDKTRETRNEKGWMTVGDVGRLDSDGFLYLTDRKNFMIISGGVNIYPQEVENLLVTHEQVADVAVFGVPCENFGEKVFAVVQAKVGSTLNKNEEAALSDELIRWCKSQLSAVKTPKEIVFTEMLPRLDNGKLYKKKLRDEYLNRQ